MPSNRARRPFSGPESALRVRVDYVDTKQGIAFVTDRYKNMQTIHLSRMRARGMYPQVGEHWFIDRSLGRYTFSSMAGPQRGPQPMDNFDCNMVFMFGGM